MLLFSLAVGVGATALLATVLAVGLAVVLVLLQRARAEARRASVVQAFMLDIFERSSTDHPDPVKAQSTTARDLLFMAVKAMRAEPPADARVAYELTWALLRVHSQLHLSDQAISLAHDAVRLAQRAFGERSMQCAMAKLWLAQDLFAVRREFKLQHQLLQQSLAVFQALRRRSERELHLARWHCAWSDLCLHEDRLDAAIDAATASLRYADAHGLQEDRRAAVARLGKLHLAAGHWSRARHFTELALDVRSGGVDLASRLRRLATLAELQMFDMELDAAEATLAQALLFAEGNTGLWSMDSVQIRLRLARVAVVAGRARDALQALQALLGAALAPEAAQGHVMAQAQVVLAEAHEAAGQRSEAGEIADTLLAGANLPWRWQATLRLLQGRLKLGGADTEGAARELAQAERLLNAHQHAPNDPLAEQALRLRAALIGAQGHGDEAAAILSLETSVDADRTPCALDQALRSSERAYWLARAGETAAAEELVHALQPAARQCGQVARAIRRVKDILLPFDVAAANDSSGDGRVITSASDPH